MEAVMWRRIKSAFDALGWGTTLWGFVPVTWQAAGVAMLSALVTILHARATTIPEGIFLGVGTLTFGMAAIYYFVVASQKLSTFGMLNLTDLNIPSFTRETRTNLEQQIKLKSIVTQAVITNTSGRNIYMRIKRGNVSFLDRTRTDGTMRDEIFLVGANGGVMAVLFPTIHDIEMPPFGSDAPKGKVYLEIEYGPSKDNLVYLYSYEGQPLLGFGQSGPKVITYNLKNEHKKIHI
jgi:hypothetical protein